MVTELKRNFCLSDNQFLANLVCMLGSFLFGSVIVLVMLRFGNVKAYFCVGTMICIFFAGFYTLLVGFLSYASEFQVCLSMGGTRRSFLAYYAVRQLLLLAVDYVFVRLAYLTECAVYARLAPGLPNEQVFTFLESLWCLPVLAGWGLLSLFLGAVRAKFGNKGMWVFWVLWIFTCTFLPRMFDKDDTSTLGRAASAMLAAILTMPATVWAAILTVTAVGMAAAVIGWGMQQSV